MNLGVFSSATYEIIWDKTGPKVAKEENCLLRTRIGQIVQNDFKGTAKDQWWRIENNTNVDKLAIELADIIINTAIPFLDYYTSINKIYEFITNLKGWQSETPQHLLNLAVVAYQMGNTLETKRIISEIINKYEPWKARCFIAANNMKLDGFR